MGRLGVTLDILNQKGTPAFYSDIFANRPSAGFAGRVFISTDTGAIYEDTGSTWTLIADAGAGTTGTLQQVTTNGNTTTQGISITAGGLSSNQVSIVGGTASQFLKANGTLDSNTYLTTGSAASTYLPLAGGTLTGNLAIPSNQLAIGTATPSAPLDVHTATGTAAQFNGTTTNNAFAFFQNAGTSKWRIGNLYNAGANSFQVYDVLNATARLTILNSGATTLNGAFTSTSVAITGGTSAQFLKADGSVDSNTYLTTGSAASTYLPLAGGTLTGALSGTSITGTSLVKSGGTSAQILAADGSVITAGTNITISAGTISASGGGGGMAIGGSITSATAGSVLYAGAAGVLAQTNASFYYDYTNNRLGLGTATPTARLNVSGSTTASSGTGIGSTFNQTLVAAANGDVLSAVYINPTFTNGAFTGVNNWALNVVGKATFQIGNNSTLGLFSSSGIIINSAGGNINNLYQITLGYGGGTYGSSAMGAFVDSVTGYNSGGLFFATRSVTTDTAPTERMRIFSSGNVAIGTTTDAGYRLDVQGTLRATGNVTIGSTTTGAQCNVYTSTYGSNGLFNSYGTDGNIKFQCGALGTNEGYIYTPASAKLSFYTGGAVTMTLNASGNLSIGNTNDTYKLDVSGTIRATGAATFGSTITATGTIQGNSQDAFVLYQSANTLDTKYWNIQNLTTSGTFRIRAVNDAITSGINAIEIARTAISSVTVAFPNGNTLVGTTTDSGQGVLQVSGGVTAGGISLTGEVLSASATLNKGYYHVFTGAAGQTLTLPSPSSNNYQYVIINNTANSVTIAAAASTTITTTTGTSVASITLIANARTFILADGSTKYYQVY